MGTINCRYSFSLGDLSPGSALINVAKSGGDGTCDINLTYQNKSWFLPHENNLFQRKLAEEAETYPSAKRCICAGPGLLHCGDLRRPAAIEFTFDWPAESVNNENRSFVEAFGQHHVVFPYVSDKWSSWDPSEGCTKAQPSTAAAGCYYAELTPIEYKPDGTYLQGVRLSVEILGDVYDPEASESYPSYRVELMSFAYVDCFGSKDGYMNLLSINLSGVVYSASMYPASSSQLYDLGEMWIQDSTFDSTLVRVHMRFF